MVNSDNKIADLQDKTIIEQKYEDIDQIKDTLAKCQLENKQYVDRIAQLELEIVKFNNSNHDNCTL